MLSHIGINQVYSILRKMAKTNKYQTLYANSKEGCVILFKNIAAYTDLQVAFLQYLSFYNSLNIDIYMNEVDEIVLDNDIYEDAYSYYKNKEKSKKNKILKTPQQQKKQAHNQKKATTVSNTHVVFSKQNVKQAVQKVKRRK